MSTDRPHLLAEIDQTLTTTPTLWWLGGASFVVKFANIAFYVDPVFSGEQSLINAQDVRHADMILANSAHHTHLDGKSVVPMLEVCKGAKLILPKSAGEYAHSLGIPYDRMTTTDSDLRVEYWKDNLYGRVYAVPSANRSNSTSEPALDWTPLGGFPYLGYLIRFGRWTIYHGGNGAPYEDLARRLRPYNVSVALVPVGGSSFAVSEAAQLASAIEAKWLVPILQSPSDENAFVAHMLGQRPDQSFKVFQRGEKWTVPEE
jgi:L-ascorbate 6-phosphate lactonase